MLAFRNGQSAGKKQQNPQQGGLGLFANLYQGEGSSTDVDGKQHTEEVFGNDDDDLAGMESLESMSQAFDKMLERGTLFGNDSGGSDEDELDRLFTQQLMPTKDIDEDDINSEDFEFENEPVEVYESVKQEAAAAPVAEVSVYHEINADDFAENPSIDQSLQLETDADIKLFEDKDIDDEIVGSLGEKSGDFKDLVPNNTLTNDESSAHMYEAPHTHEAPSFTEKETGAVVSRVDPPDVDTQTKVVDVASSVVIDEPKQSAPLSQPAIIGSTEPDVGRLVGKPTSPGSTTSFQLKLSRINKNLSADDIEQKVKSFLVGDETVVKVVWTRLAKKRRNQLALIHVTSSTWTAETAHANLHRTAWEEGFEICCAIDEEEVELPLTNGAPEVKARSDYRVFLSRIPKVLMKVDIQRHVTATLGGDENETRVTVEYMKKQRTQHKRALVLISSTVDAKKAIELLDKSIFGGEEVRCELQTAEANDDTKRDGIGAPSSKPTLTFRLSGIKVGSTEEDLREHIESHLERDVGIQQIVLQKNSKKTAQIATVTVLSADEDTKEILSTKLHHSTMNGKKLNLLKVMVVSHGSSVDNDEALSSSATTLGRSDSAGTNKVGGRAKKRSPKEIAKYEEARDLAELFHLELCSSTLLEHNKSMDREEISTKFREFVSGFSAAVERSPVEIRRLEVLVMMTMRQQKLIKSKRYGDKVVLTVAGMAGPGDFPTSSEKESGVRRVLSESAEAAKDKEGVVVSSVQLEGEGTKSDIRFVQEGGTARFIFKVSSMDPAVKLQAASLGGGAARLFSIDPPLEVPVPMSKALQFAIRFADDGSITHELRTRRGILKLEFVKDNGQEFMITRTMAVHVGANRNGVQRKDVTPKERGTGSSLQRSIKEQSEASAVAAAAFSAVDDEFFSELAEEAAKFETNFYS